MGQPELDLHHLSTAYLQASPCAGQFCPNLRMEPRVWRAQPRRWDTEGSVVRRRLGTRSVALPTWGPVLWWEAWSPRIPVPGSQSFNSYLFNKYSECGTTAVNKTKSLPSWSSSPSKRYTDYSDKQTNTGYCTLLQSATKKNKALKKNRKKERKP